MNLFIIGNSFSQNATRYLPQLAEEGGHSLHFGRAEVGGCSLQRHWEHVEAAEKGEPEGRFYTGRSLEGADVTPHEAKTLRELFSASEWDVVVFHQGSLPSSNLASYQPYAQLLCDLVHKVAPGAQILLHQTWAYRADSPYWGELGNGEVAKSQREMWAASRAAYHTIAQELGLPLIPTGDAFWKVDNDPKWQYRRDANFNFESPQYPNLPDQAHSLHAGYYWNQEGQFCIDPKHTSAAGAYLGSLMWYSFCFGESPQNVGFTPPGGEREFAAHLRMVAAQTLREHGALLAAVA